MTLNFTLNYKSVFHLEFILKFIVYKCVLTVSFLMYIIECIDEILFL